MLATDQKHRKVYCPRYSSVASYFGQETNKPHLSVCPLVVASGEWLACLVVEGGSQTRIAHVPDGDLPELAKFQFSCTTSGFMERETFETWMTRHVVPAINAHRERHDLDGRGFYLFLDGHSSHDSDVVDKLCWENNIFLVQLPSHTSHRIQPCDRGIFAALKVLYGARLADLMFANKYVTTADRVELFIKVWGEISQDTVRGEFPPRWHLPRFDGHGDERQPQGQHLRASGGGCADGSARPASLLRPRHGRRCAGRL
jgi:hypothetical protein